MTSKTIISLRATMFVAGFIPFNDNGKERLMALIPDSSSEQLNPVSGPFASMENISPEYIPWQIYSDSERIVFGPNRVDYIQTIISNKTSVEEAFTENAQRVFAQLLSIRNLSCSRLAYNITFAIDNDDRFNNSRFFGQLLSVNTFKNKDASNSHVRIAYNVDAEIQGEERNLNVILALGDGKKEIKGETNKAMPVLMGDVDISTQPNASANYGEKAIAQFLERTRALKDDLLETYKL